MIELSLLKSFLAIVDQGNFLAASNTIAKSPAAISVQIKKLEDQLGSLLFQRDARSTTLTRDGEKLLPYARRMIALETSIHLEFSQEIISGTVHMGVPDDLMERFPMKILNAFLNDYPKVKLSLHVDNTPALLKAVDKGQLDLAVVTYAESIEGILEAKILMQEPEIWASSATGIAAERNPVPITLWKKGWAWFEPALKILEEAKIEYEIILECENISGRKSAIASDLAVGPLPLSCFDKTVKPAAGFENLPPLPSYGLGLKIGQTPSDASSAIAEYLFSHFKQQ